MERRKYWRGFDYIKGLLIIAVMVGHIIPKDSYLRYIIYSFHMPMFIGIAGFLFNANNIRINVLFKKYWGRVIRPWIIAVIGYYLVLCAIGIEKLWPRNLIMSFVIPYHHLWYILGYLSYVILMIIMWLSFRNAKKPWTWIFSISAIIGILSKWELLFDETGSSLINKLFLYANYDFRLYNLLFFVLGFYIRNIYDRNGTIISKKTIIGIKSILLFSVITVGIMFFVDYKLISNIFFYLMNISLLVILLNDIIIDKVPSNRIIEFMGKYSLPIYLYHIFGKILSLKLYSEYTTPYYITCIILYSLIVLIIYFARNNVFINNVVFGTIRK